MLFSITDNFGTIGTVILLVMILVPYLCFRYSGIYKSEKKIESEKARFNFTGSFKMKFGRAYGVRWVKEVRNIIERNKGCYAEFNVKEKIVTVHYEEKIDERALRNLLIKIGYIVEIIK